MMGQQRRGMVVPFDHSSTGIGLDERLGAGL